MNAEARVGIHDGAPGPPEHPAPSWMRQCSRSLLSTRVEIALVFTQVEAAAASTLVLAYSIYCTWKSYCSITSMFHFNEDEAVNFDDLLDATQTLIPAGGASSARDSLFERRSNVDPPHASSSRLAGADAV